MHNVCRHRSEAGKADKRENKEQCRQQNADFPQISVVEHIYSLKIIIHLINYNRPEPNFQAEYCIWKNFSAK